MSHFERFTFSRNNTTTRLGYEFSRDFYIYSLFNMIYYTKEIYFVH